MEPVEINAGRYYLRRLRVDDRIDDRAAIVEGFADPELARWADGMTVPDLAAAGEYVAARERDWADGRRFSWAVADQLDPVLIGVVELREVDLVDGRAEASCWTRAGHRRAGAASESLSAVLNFGFNGIGLDQVIYRHAENNIASRRVAEKCGFVFSGRVEGGIVVDGAPCDLLVWTLDAAL